MKPRLKLLFWSVVGLLAVGFCLVAVSELSAEGQITECNGNLVRFAIALNIYSSNGRPFPPGAIPNESLPPEKRLSWIAELAPWFAANVVPKFDKSKPWDNEDNRVPKVVYGREGEGQRTVELKEFPLCVCPTHRARANLVPPTLTSYVGISGLGRDAATLPLEHRRTGMFGYNRRTSERDIKDGLASTMAVVETGMANGPWTAGGPATVRGLNPSCQPYIGRGHQFGGTHRGGLNVAFVDGSVRFIRETIDPKVFEALSTIAGGEPLPPEWDK